MRFKKILSTALSVAMFATYAGSFTVSARAEENKAMLWHAEFDGTDDTKYWVKVDGSSNFSKFDFSNLISDGVLSLVPGNISYGKFVATGGGVDENGVELPIGTVIDKENGLRSMINLEGKNDIVWETRIKVDYAGEVSNPTYTDNQFMYLLDYHPNFSAHIALRDGKVAYGGTEVENAIITPYVLKDNVWTTFKVYLDGPNKKMKLTVTDDEGGSYIGAYEKLSYGLEMKDIYQVVFTRQINTEMEWQMDYSRIYDNSLLPGVTTIKSTDGEELNGSTNMPREFTAIMNFENPITAEEMNKITVSGDANVTKTLMDEGHSVQLDFADLKYNSGYTINVPSIGMNKDSVITFSTESAPWVIFNAEFDGNDDTTKWAKYNSSATYQNAAWEKMPQNGALTYKREDAGYGAFGVRFGVGNGAYQVSQTAENIVVSTRFKANVLSGNELMTIRGRRLSQNTDDSFEMAEINERNGKFYIGSEFREQLSGCIDTGMEMKTDTWYNVKIKLNYNQKNYVVEISDDNGNSTKTTKGFIWGMDQENLTEIVLMRTDLNNPTYDVDYLRVYNADYPDFPTAAASYNNKPLNGQSGLPVTGFDATIVFGSAVTEADLEKITIDKGASLTKELQADGKTVIVSVSDLMKKTQYTITVGDCGMNLGNSFAFETADDPWWIFKAEFNPGENPVGWSWRKNETNGKEFIITNEADGTVELTAIKFESEKPAISFADAIDLTDKEDIVVETRFKFIKRDNGADAPIFALEDDTNDTWCKAGIYLKNDGKLALSGSNANNANNVLDFAPEVNTFYTYRMNFNAKTQMYSLTVKDDAGTTMVASETVKAVFYPGTFDVKKLNNILFGYTYYNPQVVDYVRIWDNSMIPQITATRANGTSLANAANVRDGETVTVNLASPITKEQLSGIQLDGNDIDSALVNNGSAVEVTLNNIGNRTMHTLSIPVLGDNGAKDFTFRSADEGKYLYRAEFDGNDDKTPMFFAINNSQFEDVASSYINDGKLSYNFNQNPYRGFRLNFSDKGTDADATWSKPIPQGYALDCTGKKNISFETKIMFGEGKIDAQALVFGNNIAMLKTDENRILRYDGDGGSSENSKGKAFMVNEQPFKMEANKWYTITANFDFTAQRYSVSVDDGAGNIASSGTLNFIYNAPKYEISSIYFQKNLADNYCPVSIDYIRLVDRDYGKVNVTYGDGVELEGAATVTPGDVFTFTTSSAITTTAGIKLLDEDGDVSSISVSLDANTVTITPTALGYNKKYTLIIPKTVIGSENDQEIKFTTMWNPDAEFVYPSGYSASDALNVVFFGGSITQMDGWRVHVSDWFKEKFPNSNCYNAAVGGTGSKYGWERLERDVISKNPDVVFVEYAVNDSTDSQTAKYMESIVRNLNSQDKKPVIIFVYTTVLDFNTNTYAINEHEKIAKAYGIPSINIHDYIKTLYNTDPDFAKDWAAKVYLPDGTHPSAGCSSIYGGYVNSLLTSDSAKYFVKPKDNASVEAVTEYKNYTYSYNDEIRALTEDGQSTTFAFSGDELVLEAKRGADAGNFTLTVDGKMISTYDKLYINGNYPNVHILYTGLGEGTHTATVTVSGKNTDATGYNVTITSIFWKAAAEHIEFTKPVFNSNAVTEGTELKATASYVSNRETAYSMAIALYDNAGRLTKIVRVESITDDSETEQEISVTITPKAGDAKAKAFIWDSLKNAKPITEAAVLN